MVLSGCASFLCRSLPTFPTTLGGVLLLGCAPGDALEGGGASGNPFDQDLSQQNDYEQDAEGQEQRSRGLKQLELLAKMGAKLDEAISSSRLAHSTPPQANLISSEQVRRLSRAHSHRARCPRSPLTGRARLHTTRLPPACHRPICSSRRPAATPLVRPFRTQQPWLGLGLGLGSTPHPN